MTDREFERVKSILKSVFPRIEYLDNRDSALVFFNILNRYQFEDTWQGVRNCVEIEKYAPAISTIAQYIEEAEKARKEKLRTMSAPERDSMTVKCTRCNDAGFMWVTYKDGTETARICNCAVARERNPWCFMTEEELDRKNDELRKRGQNPPRGKPGHPSEWWRQECGEVVSISPGRRIPGKRKER